MFGRPWIALLFFACVACQRDPREKQTAPSPNRGPERSAGAASKPEASHPTVSLPRLTPLSVCRSEGQEPLEAARKYYDQGKFEDALSCAAQACAFTPDDPQAHSERGAALSALGRFEEAQLAYARALALEPRHLDALLGAAHLYAVSLPSNRERDELGSLYAERGLELADEQGENQLVAEFALLSAMAFNDLGQARDALERAEEMLRLEPGDAEARYERAVALFELCRFAEAKPAFTDLLADSQRSAHAHHHLGLLLEREGRWKAAERHFNRARELDSDDFPEPQILPEEEFRAEVTRAVAGLPQDMRRDLAGVPVTAEELPRDDDLLSGEPPLSPAILGLFRGPPLSERCAPEDLAPGEPCRSVALYRRNLARAVKSKEELIEQIQVTLLHEIGHLRGEDDFELAARGLE
ncbi:MAG: metallopeptidase family protein [Myxococcales bacterium]|nr:metallopeptidase family protein [Myxococcales bacterium]